eukprot:14197743-Alexandrium_andersonii.AAC.1
MCIRDSCGRGKVRAVFTQQQPATSKGRAIRAVGDVACSKIAVCPQSESAYGGLPSRIAGDQAVRDAHHHDAAHVHAEAAQVLALGQQEHHRAGHALA